MQINLNFLTLLRCYVIALIGLLYSHCSMAGSLDLSWQGSASTNVGGYIISYGTSSGSYTNEKDVGNNTSGLLADLQEGVNYYIAVKAYSADRTAFSPYSNEIRAIIPVTTALSANFTTDRTTGNAPLVVKFTGSATKTVQSWEWNFGDASIPAQNTQSPTVTYSTPGTYSVSLKVTDTNNQTFTALKSNLIVVASPPPPAPPVANFSPGAAVSGSIPFTVAFTDTSTGSITSRQWNFGNGLTSTETSPRHTYTTPGVYTVSLTVTGQGGSDTVTRNALVTVTNPPLVNTGTDTSPVANLVAAYGFDDLGNQIVADSSGNGNHGYVRGGALKSTGQFGQALLYDGIDDWVLINHTKSQNLGTGMTIEAWVYPKAVKRSNIVIKETASGSAYDLYAYEDGDMPIGSFNDGQGYKWVHGVQQLPVNQWSHVATTYDGANLRLFINGIQVAVRAATGAIVNSYAQLSIGGSKIWQEFFNGSIDEVRIYNKALSAGQISADMAQSISDKYPTAYTFGDQAANPNVATFAAGRAVAYQAIPGKTNVTTEVMVNVVSGSTAKSIEVAIYSDSNGRPGQRISNGLLSSPVVGTNKVKITSALLTGGRPYWIAAMSKGGGMKLQTVASATGAPRETSVKGLNSLPFAWVSGTKLQNGSISLFGKGFN